MKQNSLLKTKVANGVCDSACCQQCAECKVIHLEAKGMEVKPNFTQLYAKEAEHYFFYYDLNLKQSS